MTAPPAGIARRRWAAAAALAAAAPVSPSHAPPATAMWLYVPPSASAAMEPARVPGVDPSPSAPRPLGQSIARTCLELPSARSRPRLTFRRRHTPSPPHGDPPFRNLIKATSPLDALPDSSLDAAARARRTSPLSALGRCKSHLCRGSCYIGMVRATGMGHITKASRYSVVSRVSQHEPPPRLPSACDDVHHHRNRTGQMSIRSGPPFRKVALHQDYM